MTTSPDSQEDARRELDSGELLQQHGHDVRAARGGLLAHDDALPHADHHRSEQAGQQQVVRQVEPTAQQQRRIERLDGRRIGIDQPCEDVHETRREERRDDRPRAELPAEDQQRGEHQRNVEHVAERTDLHRRENVVQHDTHAVNAARHEVVGIHEEHETRAHEHATQKNQHPRAPPRPRSHRFEKSFRIHSRPFKSAGPGSARPQPEVSVGTVVFEIDPHKGNNILRKSLPRTGDFSRRTSGSGIFSYICM